MLPFAGSGSSHVLDVGLSTRQGPYAFDSRVTDTLVSLFQIFITILLFEMQPNLVVLTRSHAVRVLTFTIILVTDKSAVGVFVSVVHLVIFFYSSDRCGIIQNI